MRDEHIINTIKKAMQNYDIEATNRYRIITNFCNELSARSLRIEKLLDRPFQLVWFLVLAVFAKKKAQKMSNHLKIEALKEVYDRLEKIRQHQQDQCSKDKNK